MTEVQDITIPFVSAFNTEERSNRELNFMRDWVHGRVLESQNGLLVEETDLTPELAAVLLSRNPSNRPISKPTVDKFKRDIDSGRWELNGEPIIVAKSGELNDGQHRCAAVVASGNPIPCLIVFGVERDSRLTLDQGLVRTVGHYMGMQGTEYSNHVAALASCVGSYLAKGRISRYPADRPTKAETLQVAAQHPELVDSVRAVSNKGSATVGGKTVLAFCHWLICRRAENKSQVETFVRHLVSGENLVGPMLYVRDRLSREKSSLTQNQKAELVIRAWNCVRRGETPKKLPANDDKLPRVEP